MSWYLQYQRAEDIIRENQRRARMYRIARLAEEDAGADELRPTTSALRRALGWAVLAIGRATTRLGGTVTRVGHALHGAGATPAA